jgi:signal peptidase I
VLVPASRSPTERQFEGRLRGVPFLPAAALRTSTEDAWRPPFACQGQDELPDVSFHSNYTDALDEIAGLIKLFLCCILIGLVGGIWFSYLRPTSLGGPASYMIFDGSSMEPALHDGDFAFLQKQSNYTLGDVVAVSSDGSKMIHRIVGFEGSAYITRGDGDSVADALQPSNLDIEGKVVLSVPAIGRLPGGFLIPALAGLALVLLVLTALVRRRARLRTAAVATSPLIAGQYLERLNADASPAPDEERRAA